MFFFLPYWSPKNLRLRSGSSINKNGTLHYLRKVVNHDPSIDSFYDNDIALLFLKEPFVFSDTVQPIKLPNQELEAGTLVMIAGYGSTREKVRITENERPINLVAI